MALSVGLCIVLTDNLTGPKTNGMLQARRVSQLWGREVPCVVKFWRGKYWRIVIAGLSYYFVVEQYNIIAIIYSYVTIVHFEIKASNSVQK